MSNLQELASASRNLQDPKRVPPAVSKPLPVVTLNIPTYGALRILASLLCVVGWIVLIVGVLGFLLALLGVAVGTVAATASGRSGGMLLGFGIFPASATILVGVTFLTQGELLRAIRDIAINSFKK